MDAAKNTFCVVCERTGHNARHLANGASECPARVIRIKRECGSAVLGSDPGTR